MGVYNTREGGGVQVVIPQQISQQNWNDQPSYSGYGVSGSDTVSGEQSYGWVGLEAMEGLESMEGLAFDAATNDEETNGTSSVTPLEIA